MRAFVVAAVFLTFGSSAYSDLGAAPPKSVPDMTAPASDPRLYLASGRGPRGTTVVNNSVYNSRAGHRQVKRKRYCKGPEYDSRCIRVISDPATVPPGVNVMPDVASQRHRTKGRRVHDPDADHYPACSTVDTDNCVQTYERAGGPR